MYFEPMNNIAIKEFGPRPSLQIMKKGNECNELHSQPNPANTVVVHRFIPSASPLVLVLTSMRTN